MIKDIDYKLQQLVAITDYWDHTLYCGNLRGFSTMDSSGSYLYGHLSPETFIWVPESRDYMVPIRHLPANLKI